MCYLKPACGCFYSASPAPPYRYEKIAESLDQKVFDARVVLHDDVTPETKRNNLDAVDVEVEASMGRVKLVFLMKFVNDFLKFLGRKEGQKKRNILSL